MKTIWVKYLVACGIMVALIGCVNVTPIGPGHTYEPDDRELRLWEAYRGFSESIQASGKVYHNAELRDYVQSVLERVLGNNLSAYIPLQPHIIIIDSPVINAYSLPNGHILVHTALLGRIRNEAQLAMLMGHEITHATHRHVDQIRDDAIARSDILAYINIVTVIGGASIHDALTGLSSWITRAAISGYSRRKEEEADEVGLTLISQAGYSPGEGAKMFQQMLNATSKKDRRWNALYATHPKMKNRVKSCKRLFERLHPDLRAHAKEIGQDRYVEHAAPLIFAEVERHIGQGKYDLALETLRFLLQVLPKDEKGPTLLGDLYRARHRDGDYALAETAYRDALMLNSECADTHRGLGYLYVKTGAFEDAKKHLQKYITLRPGASDAKFVSGYINRLEAD